MDFKGRKKSKEFGDKLKDLLESKDMTQRDLAKKLFLTDTAVGNYISGRRLPRYETTKQIAEYFGVTTDFLLGIDTTKKPIEIQNAIVYQPEEIKIPILGDVRAGLPTLISEENIIGYEYIGEDLKKQGELFALRVKGDSMEPRMFDGDLAIVKRTPDVESGAVGVVLVNGDEATVKRIIKNQNGITLIPFNSKYNIINYSNDDIMNKPVMIVGQVLEVRAKL